MDQQSPLAAEKSHPAPHVAQVALEKAIDKLLDYAIPAHLSQEVHPGTMVEVLLRGRKVKGFVVATKTHSDFDNLQPIVRVAGEKPLLPPDLLELSDWIARYYCTPVRRVMKSMLPAPVRREVGAREQLFVTRAKTRDELAELAAQLRRKQPSQAAVLDAILKVEKGLLLTDLLERAEVSRSPVESLIRAGALSMRVIEVDRSPLDTAEYILSGPKTLHTQQAEALTALQKTLSECAFGVHLILGVTGSGKTEVYLQAMDAALKQGRGVILMVPEIALTGQLVERFRARFPDRAAILHHRLSDGERHDQWQKLRRGELQVAIGARSVIFAPVQNLGLLIVDEEHESSYKSSEEMPAVHARDLAIVRGKICKATVVLGSATPSLESMTNALAGRYQLHRITQRAEAHQLPAVKMVDMKVQRERGFQLFSQPLLEGIEQRMRRGEQSLVFLNRRGYFTLQKCLSCDQSVQCPHCAVSLTFHKGEDLLACHCCGYQLSPPPTQCPHCQSLQTLRFRGVGTEQVERQLHRLLPEVRTLRLDADTTKHKGSHEQILRQFGLGRADVLIGTQMIAKGLHFPAVTLVGVLQAETSLQVPDFRAAETTFQLITQVAGRAGRGKLPGEVLIQTSIPDHPVLQLAARQDYEAFYQQEMEARGLVGFPPHGRLVRFVVSGEDLNQLEGFCSWLHEWLASRLPREMELYPPLPCGRAKVKDKHRMCLMVKMPRAGMLQGLLDPLECPQGLSLLIDVDPTSTFF
jgi:primosomal protein N' (replication factor Y)